MCLRPTMPSNFPSDITGSATEDGDPEFGDMSLEQLAGVVRFFQLFNDLPGVFQKLHLGHSRAERVGGGRD